MNHDSAKGDGRHEKESAGFVAFAPFRGFRVSECPADTEGTERGEPTEKGLSALRVSVGSVVQRSRGD